MAKSIKGPGFRVRSIRATAALLRVIPASCPGRSYAERSEPMRLPAPAKQKPARPGRRAQFHPSHFANYTICVSKSRAVAKKMQRPCRTENMRGGKTYVSASSRHDQQPRRPRGRFRQLGRAPPQLEAARRNLALVMLASFFALIVGAGAAPRAANGCRTSGCATRASRIPHPRASRDVRAEPRRVPPRLGFGRAENPADAGLRRAARRQPRRREA
jgi:hypothetical protein